MMITIRSNKGSGDSTKIYNDKDEDITGGLAVHKISIDLEAGKINNAVLSCWAERIDIAVLPKDVTVNVHNELTVLAFDIKAIIDDLHEDLDNDPHAAGYKQGLNGALELIKRLSQEKQ